MAIYPEATNFNSRYFTRNNGQGLAAPINVQGQRKIDSVTFCLCGAVSGYIWYGQSCTGTGRTVKAGIWLNEPTGQMTYPDFVSTNEINVATQGGKISSSYNYDIRNIPGHQDSTFYFDNAIVDKDNVWIGIVSSVWETGNNNTDLVFATNRSGSYNSKMTYYNNSYNWTYVNKTDWTTAWALGIVGLSVSDPYTSPSIRLNSVDSIGKVDITNYSINYTITKGSNNIVNSYANIYNTANNLMQSSSFGRVTGGSFNETFKLHSGNGFTNAGHYLLNVSCKDNTKTVYSPEKWDIYTYQKPTIDETLSLANGNVQNANSSNTFTISGTNNRAWSLYEDEFQTRYRIRRAGESDYSNWIELGNITSWTRSTIQMRELVPKAYDGLDNFIEFDRYSPSSVWESDNKASSGLRLYYRPRSNVSTASITYRKNSSSGSSVSKNQVIPYNDSLTGINISFTFDSESIIAGYTQGYRIRLYNRDQELVKTYYTDVKNITIKKEDIPKMQNTYIDITTYYKNDSNNPDDYWYYNRNTINKIEFIILSTALNKPIITYPVDNSNWINKQFRICFQLPEDPDKGNETEIYHYENIEVEINGSFIIKMKNSIGTTTSAQLFEKDNLFSCSADDLLYKRNMIVYPFATESLPNNSSYRIRVRVQKRYYEVSDTNYGWSVWSDYCNINITNINETFNEGDFIKADHYNKVKNTIDRMRKTYGVIWNNIPSTILPGMTTIQQIQYNYNIFLERLNDIKNTVNTFGPIEPEAEGIKFDAINELLTSFTPIEEYITALSDNTAKPGKNYMNIIYDNCKLLK